MKDLENALKRKSFESFEELELSVKKFIEKFQHKRILSHIKLIKMLSFVIPKIISGNIDKMNLYLESIDYDRYCAEIFYNKDFDMQKFIEDRLKAFLEFCNEVEIGHKINQATKFIKNELKIVLRNQFL